MDDDTPDALVGDEARLGQVLRNLLSNALKFTTAGSVGLQVGVAERTQHTATLRFSVADTGGGIDPDYLPHIFDSFTQGDSSYAKQHGGTGLGLAICKSLAEQMGGDIHIASTPGQGATVTASAVFGLDEMPSAALGAHAATQPMPQATNIGAASDQSAPAAAAPTALAPGEKAPGNGASGAPGDAEPITAAAGAAAENAAAPACGGLRVLLAEDNAIGRVLMEHLLTSSGHEATCVGDGLEVLAALKEHEFDLVLMDVQMPRMDGIAATRKIRQGAAGKKNAGVAIIALTAYASNEDRQHFLDCGMDDAVPKPAEEDALMAAMERAMRVAGQRQGSHADGACAPQDEALQAPVLDQAYLERSFAEYQDLLQTMLLQLHNVSLPEMERSLALVLRENNLTTGRAVAHRARGTLGTIGAARAAAVAARAEHCADRQDDIGFRHCAGELLRELAALKEHLQHSGLLAETEAQ